MAGWDDIEHIERATLKKIPEIDKLFLKVFGTTEGKKLMAWLVDQTINKASFIPGADHSTGYFLEGKKDLVREMQLRIRRALDV
tara:strand:+ start:1764 stop:2015 length:252 start_codon:yes stop_codon:yes gene_type:complete